MTEITTPLIYVVLWGEHPIGASRDLDEVKRCAERHAPPNNFHSETRWDETWSGNEWQLMALGKATRRWRKTSYVIRTAPLLDPDA